MQSLKLKLCQILGVENNELEAQTGKLHYCHQ